MSRTITIGGSDVTIQRFTLAKAMRVITLLGLIQKAVPELNASIAQFRREYAQANVQELDRVQAKMRFGPTPVFDDDDRPLFHEGEMVTIASPVDRMTEKDWEQSGHTLKLPQHPAPAEILVAVFPELYEKAEKPIQRLLGLVIMNNDDVSRYVTADEIWERVDDLVHDRIDGAYLEEIMELIVAVGETVDGQVMTKARALGDRLGNLRRLFGMGKASTTPPATSTTSSAPAEQPSSSSSSPSEAGSTGPTPTASSDSPGTSSTPSASSSLARAI